MKYERDFKGDYFASEDIESRSRQTAYLLIGLLKKLRFRRNNYRGWRRSATSRCEALAGLDQLR